MLGELVVSGNHTCVEVKPEEKQLVIQPQQRPQLMAGDGRKLGWPLGVVLRWGKATMLCTHSLGNLWMWWPLGSRRSFEQGSLLGLSLVPRAGQSSEVVSPSVPRGLGE